MIALIITFRRLPLAIETIRSVKQYVHYPNIGFHIADDGSGPEYVRALLEEIGPEYSVEVTDAARGGVGHSMNLGIDKLLYRADFWLHLEDDWVLHQPLDLEPCVRLLSEDEGLGMIRLGRISAGVGAQVIGGADKTWWRLIRGSDTYILTGNAALRHRRMWDAYGPYTEGLPPGQTELNYCGKFNTAKSGPDVVWPAWMNTSEMFQHIGDHQSFKWHMETGGHSAEEAAEIFDQMDSAVTST